MAYVSDVSDYDLFTKYSIRYEIDDNGIFLVQVFLNETNEKIGIIGKHSGQWKILGDKRDEYSNLIKAIRVIVNTYQYTKVEFDEMLVRFNTPMEKPEEIPNGEIVESRDDRMARLRKEFGIERE
jgi:hypothetical protein